MSNPFLSFGGDSAGLESLTKGIVPINAASLQAQNLTPNTVVRTNASRGLVTGQVQLADLAFSVVSNPVLGDLTLTGGELLCDNVVSSGLDLNVFATTVGNDVLVLQTKTTDISYAAGNTTVSGTLTATAIKTNSIVDHVSGSQLINIDSNSIDLFTSAATLNGDDLAVVGSNTGVIAATDFSTASIPSLNAALAEIVPDPTGRQHIIGVNAIGHIR